MIGCLTETTTCVVAKPLVYYKEILRDTMKEPKLLSECVVIFALSTLFIHISKLKTHSTKKILMSKIGPEKLDEIKAYLPVKGKESSHSHRIPEIFHH